VVCPQSNLTIPHDALIGIHPHEQQRPTGIGFTSAIFTIRPPPLSLVSQKARQDLRRLDPTPTQLEGSSPDLRKEKPQVG
jgi:hypothetical protein